MSEQFSLLVGLEIERSQNLISVPLCLDVALGTREKIGDDNPENPAWHERPMNLVVGPNALPRPTDQNDCGRFEAAMHPKSGVEGFFARASRRWETFTRGSRRRQEYYSSRIRNLGAGRGRRTGSPILVWER